MKPSLGASDGLQQVRSEIATREYGASRDAAGLQAPNRVHGLRTWFDATGIQIHDRGAANSRLAALRLVGVGRRGSPLVAVPPGTVVSTGPRVEIRRPGLVEWYVNTPAGLEQGFTLEQRAAGRTPLVVELEVVGAQARLDADTVVLASPTGRRLRYGQLVARDAAGVARPAQLEVPSPSRLRLVIEDAGAAYPLVIDPLITGDGVAAAWLASDQVGADFAWSIAGAGDVNGDGYDDVIVGAPWYDTGGEADGAAFVFLGSTTGIADGDPTTAASRLVSDHVASFFGWSVAGAGDVNGDGYDDVIVGAFSYFGEGAGAAFVFLGSATGIADGGPATAATQLGSQAFGAFGHSVAGSGDVNGDGYADVIVGAPYFSEGGMNAGAAFVFFGGAGGIADAGPESAAARLVSDQPGANFGWSVAGGGDVDGDGHDDVIVGAPYAEAGEFQEGAAFVFRGSSTGIANGNPASAAARLESNEPGALLGWSVASAGDVNGDGFGDVIVAAPLFDAGESNEGAAFVFLGGASGIPDGGPATAAARLESNQVGVYDGFPAYTFAHSVAGAGDVNGDGYGDVMVGAPRFDASQATAGAAFVFLGSATGIGEGNPTTAVADFDSAAAGWCVAGAGDVNGDGRADVLVGAREVPTRDATTGGAFVFLGDTCSNGLDDDGDGLVDYPADPGCGSPAGLSERGDAVCDDGRDNDGDGLGDFPADPGCSGAADSSERGTAVCDNGFDEDGDGAEDYPADPGCSDLADPSERGTAACDNDVDDDGDGYSDQTDPGCYGPSDISEFGDNECDDGVDDDADGRVDYPADHGCTDLTDASEAVRFDDGGSHLIDSSSSVYGDSVVVAPQGALGFCPTSLRIVSGVIGLDAAVLGPSSMEIAGGTIGRDVITSGRVTLAGGFVAGSVELNASLEGLFISGHLYMTGGSVAGGVRLRYYSGAAFLGGVVSGDLETWDQATALIAGGTLAGDLLVNDESVVVIRGSDFNLGPGEVTATSGQITGTLEDGTPIDASFQRAPGATIRVGAPELAVCGNLLLEAGEECDDALANEFYDDCSPTCHVQVLSSCGVSSSTTTTSTTSTITTTTIGTTTTVSSTTSTTMPPSKRCSDAEAVVAARAEIDTECDCAGAANHRSYVRCAKGVVRRRAYADSLSRACKALVRESAVESTCGKPGFVACCLMRQGVTTCEIKRATTCSAKGGSPASQTSCSDACGASSPS